MFRVNLCNVPTLWQGSQHIESNLHFHEVFSGRRWSDGRRGCFQVRCEVCCGLGGKECGHFLPTHNGQRAERARSAWDASDLSRPFAPIQMNHVVGGIPLPIKGRSEHVVARVPIVEIVFHLVGVFVEADAVIQERITEAIADKRAGALLCLITSQVQTDRPVAWSARPHDEDFAVLPIRFKVRPQLVC